MSGMRGDVSQANQFYLAQGQNNLMNSPSTNQQIKDGQMRPLPSPGGVEARHQSIQNMAMGQVPQDFMPNVSTLSNCLFLFSAKFGLKHRSEFFLLDPFTSVICYIKILY